MPAPIVFRPQYGPWDQLLPQMFMMKMKHNYDVKERELAIQQNDAALKEQQGYTEGREKSKRQGQLAEKGFTPTAKGSEGSVDMPVAGGSYKPFKAQAITIGGVNLIETKPGQYIKADSSQGELIKQYQASIQDGSWNPVKTKGNQMSGGTADFMSYMKKAGATPLEDKIKLKQTETSSSRQNVELSKQRLVLSQQQRVMQQRKLSLDAEQMIMGNPKDPRVSTAVRQFQNNAGDQPYFYITKENQGWFGGKNFEGKKIPLPVNPTTNEQITAKDVMDTMKAHPKKFRTPQDVLTALGAM